MAASVLGFVHAGLAIFGGLVLLFAFAAVDSGQRAEDAGAVLVATLFQFVVCGFLIYASVMLLQGRSRQLFQGCMVCMVALSVFYFFIYVERLNEVPDDSLYSRGKDELSGSLVVPVVFAALAIVALCLAGGRRTREFCANSTI
jgi:Ca2+/Na+ antiporter